MADRRGCSARGVCGRAAVRLRESAFHKPSPVISARVLAVCAAFVIVLGACGAFTSELKAPEHLPVNPVAPGGSAGPPAPQQATATTTGWSDAVAEAGEYETAWQTIGPGLESAQVRVSIDGYADWLVLVRVDPDRMGFRVYYAPHQPLRVRAWFASLAAWTVINGGFFDAENRATGLVIADGAAHGRSYRGFGGMFFVRDDRPDLIWLAQQSYRPDAAITQAVQGYPMLVSDGRAIDSFPEDGRRNRRSFVGIDQAGRVVLGVTTAPVWTLSGLAGYLADHSGLRLDRALNLDGGASSGIWIAGVPEAMLVNSIDPVPAVIAVVSVIPIGQP